MLPELVALVLLVALTAYALTGGADFGGGVWDLFASGPRKHQQRKLIERAIAPIWEANHVWLILMVVVLFVALPSAYAAISTALHIPLLLMLIGIVLRGAAFVFRSYDPSGADPKGWRLTFAIASLVSPLFLGVVLGAVVAGDLGVDPVTLDVTTDFVSAWWGPFPFAVGLFVLSLFAWLAAVYLTVEVRDADPDADVLREDFRRRAIFAGFAAGAVSLVVLILAFEHAPTLAAALSRPAFIAIQIAGALLGLAAIFALYRRRYRLARPLAVSQVALIVLGLGFAQWPHVIAPDITFARALAPESVVAPMLIALAIGLPPLLVALAWLYRVFKK